MQDQGNIQAEAAAAEGAENRREHRRRTLKQARVVLGDNTVLDCKLRDVTDAGARLVFSAPVALPDEFRLFNVSDKLMAPVRLEWQRNYDAGVAFTGPFVPHADF